jgi:hypothetical protein
MGSDMHPLFYQKADISTRCEISLNVVDVITYRKNNQAVDFLFGEIQKRGKQLKVRSG